MLALKAYFDESGHIMDDPNLPFTGIAGFVAPAKVWEDVEKEWHDVICAPQYDLKEPFHMRHFAHRNLGQFKGWEKAQKDSLYKSLIAILVEFEAVPTGCIVSNSAFESLSVLQQAALRSPYSTALQECIRGACFQALGLEPEKVEMVFARQTDYGTVEARGEDNSDNAGTTEKLYYAIKRNLPGLGQYMGTYGSGEPDCMIQLQAADMLAYEMTQEYKNVLESQHSIRKSYQELLRVGGGRQLIKYLDRLALLNILKESDCPYHEGFEEIEGNNIQQIFAGNSARIVLNRRRERGAFNYSFPKWHTRELQRRWT